MTDSGKFKLVLASKSPRRQELLRSISSDFEVRVQDVEEIYDPELDPYLVPEYLAKLKAMSLLDGLKDNELILTADTIVILNGEILGKPEDAGHAVEMLHKISGNRHDVLTACCLKNKEKEVLFSVRTSVYFKKLSDEMIRYYVDRFQPLDKAGAYGIQEWIGMIGVSSIEGSYYNVMGLPLAELWDELQKF